MLWPDGHRSSPKVVGAINHGIESNAGANIEKYCARPFTSLRPRSAVASAPQRGCVSRGRAGFWGKRLRPFYGLAEKRGGAQGRRRCAASAVSTLEKQHDLEV